jgi:hypothetical protein
MRTHLLRSAAPLTVLVAVLVAELAGALGPAAAAETTPDADDPVLPAVVMEDLPADIEAMVEWALGLFEQAGMELPPLEIRHHGDDVGGCDGHDGLHRPGEPRNVVELCTNDVTFATQAMVLHELAHAWVDDSVGPTARAAFQAVRGYAHWQDYAAAPWHENGIEQAAEIVAWGLFDRPMAMSRITGNSCDELDAGFRALTGMAPLHGLRDLC